MIGQEFLFQVSRVSLSSSAHDSPVQVPSSELENRKLAGVVQVYKNGIRKNICWFSRKIIKEDVLFGETVYIFSELDLSKAKDFKK